MASREEWGSWKQHPVTQEFFRIMDETREQGFDEVAYGTADNELIRLGIKIGKLNVLTGILNYGFIPVEEDNG